MKTFRQHLSEAIISADKIKPEEFYHDVKYQHNIIYHRAEIGKNIIHTRFESHPDYPRHWEMIFSNNYDEGLHGHGGYKSTELGKHGPEGAAIMRHVGNVFAAFVKHHKPKSISYSAANKDLDKVYNHVSPTLAKETGGKHTIEDPDVGKLFPLHTIEYKHDK